MIYYRQKVLLALLDALGGNLPATYWRQLRRYNGDKKLALKDVENKYMKDLVQDRDIHFFVGTNQSWDIKLAPNPFLIIGVFSPPIVFQDELF